MFNASVISIVSSSQKVWLFCEKKRNKDKQSDKKKSSPAKGKSNNLQNLMVRAERQQNLQLNFTFGFLFRLAKCPPLPCPVVKPEFVCGTDNSTYSSQCRLNFTTVSTEPISKLPARVSALVRRLKLRQLSPRRSLKKLASANDGINT